MGGPVAETGSYASFADLSPAAVFVRDTDGRYV